MIINITKNWRCLQKFQLKFHFGLIFSARTKRIKDSLKNDKSLPTNAAIFSESFSPFSSLIQTPQLGTVVAYGKQSRVRELMK